MTYYSRGSILAAIFDVMIINNSKGKEGLDAFLKQLYTKFHKGLNRGFSDVEFKVELEKFVGKDLTDFYKKYINGTEILPYAEIFDKVGYKEEECANCWSRRHRISNLLNVDQMWNRKVDYV